MARQRAPREAMVPSISVSTFTDPDAHFAGFRNLQISGVVTHRGAYRATATRIDLHRLWSFRHDDRLPRIMRIAPSGERVGLNFITASDQPALLFNGVEISDGQIVANGVDWEWYTRSSAPCEWAVMSLSVADLATASKAIIGRELGPPSFARALSPPAQVLSRLRALHEAAAHLAHNTPDILIKSEVARAMEEALVEAMVFSLAADDPVRLRNVERTRRRVMRHLEEVLVMNSGQTLYMSELCAQLGVSYWTLNDCCSEYLGMSAKRYLWMRRMNMARRALQNAEAESTTITEIATNYGFWELGRFSVAYRSLFGEAPSTALRRLPGVGSGKNEG